MQEKNLVLCQIPFFNIRFSSSITFLRLEAKPVYVQTLLFCHIHYRGSVVLALPFWGFIQHPSELPEVLGCVHKNRGVPQISTEHLSQVLPQVQLLQIKVGKKLTAINLYCNYLDFLKCSLRQKFQYFRIIGIWDGSIFKNFVTIQPPTILI